MKRIICLSACLGICAFAQGTKPHSSSPATAASFAKNSSPVPPKDEIRRVLDYYFNGKNSPPALVELTPCLKVDTQKASETYSQCIEIAGSLVPLNTRLNLWTMWYLPQNSQYENIILQVFWNDQLHLKEEYRLETQGRFRTWKTVNLNKKGTWTFKISHGTQELGSHKLAVE